MSAPRIVALIVVVAVAGFIGWRIIDSAYVQKRQAITSRLVAAQGALETFGIAEREMYPPIAAEIEAIVNRTLGGTRETVEAELRARLNRIVTESGLAEASVTTGRHAFIATPAKRHDDLRRSPLRDEPDFAEQEASISAAATLDAAMRLIDFIERAPWIKRIDSIDLDPNAAGDRFDVTVRLTTLYVPGQEPDPEAVDTGYGESRFALLTGFIDANRFALPEAPAQPAQPEEAVTQQPQPPRGFPYNQWKLTGVVQGASGVEVWLSNQNNQKSRTLSAGEKIGDLEFIFASDDEAEFMLEGSHYIVRVGATLSDRVAIKVER